MLELLVSYLPPTFFKSPTSGCHVIMIFINYQLVEVADTQTEYN